MCTKTWLENTRSGKLIYWSWLFRAKTALVIITDKTGKILRAQSDSNEEIWERSIILTSQVESTNTIIGLPERGKDYGILITKTYG